MRALSNWVGDFLRAFTCKNPGDSGPTKPLACYQFIVQGSQERLVVGDARDEKALRQAVSHDDRSNEFPSTKGSL